MTLDLETLEMLDEICELHPDLNSRSAAIRWCVRIGVNNLCNHENNRKKEKRR